LRRIFTKLFAILLCLSVAPSGAGEETGVADYAYSVFVGTGRYKIDDRTIYVFRAPLIFDLKEVDYESGANIGLTLLLPVAVGLTDFEDDDELPELSVNDLQTVVIAPGLEVPIALKQNWQLKPFAQVGIGADLKSDTESFVWGTGVRTSATLGEDANWLVGGEFLYAGNDPNNGDSTTSFSRLGAGVEYRIPTQQEFFSRRISWHARIIRWYFTNAVNFEPPLRPQTLNETTEFGIAVGFSRPFNIFGYQLHQAGISFETANDYKAIGLYTSFPF
jgi:hypothetical protein